MEASKSGEKAVTLKVEVGALDPGGVSEVIENICGVFSVEEMDMDDEEYGVKGQEFLSMLKHIGERAWHLHNHNDPCCPLRDMAEEIGDVIGRDYRNVPSRGHDIKPPYREVQCVDTSEVAASQENTAHLSVWLKPHSDAETLAGFVEHIKGVDRAECLI